MIESWIWWHIPTGNQLSGILSPTASCSFFSLSFFFFIYYYIYTHIFSRSLWWLYLFSLSLFFFFKKILGGKCVSSFSLALWTPRYTEAKRVACIFGRFFFFVFRKMELYNFLRYRFPEVFFLLISFKKKKREKRPRRGCRLVKKDHRRMRLTTKFYFLSRRE